MVFVYKKLAQFAVRGALPPRRSESPVCATDNKPSCVLHLLGWFIGSRGFSSLERRPEFWVLQCPMSESPSRKREDLHDNATRKGREIYCWLESGPLLQPTQWCKVREPWAPVSTHIYRVLDFKHKQWVVITSRLFTCLQSNFIGQTHFNIFVCRGLSQRFTWHVLIGWSLVADNYPTLGRNWSLGLLIVQGACHGASYVRPTRGA